jgi:hypothetical protein
MKPIHRVVVTELNKPIPAYDENDTIAFAGVAGYKFSDEAGANVRSGHCAGAAQGTAPLQHS